MPTYRYECAACGKIHEVFQSIREGRKRKCPDCGGRLHRLFGAGGGVLLRGSGFYSTENRPKPPPEKKEGRGDSGAKE